MDNLSLHPFQLERFFAKYEFKVRHLLSPSDCEALSLKELLAISNDSSRQLWEDLRLGYTESAGHPLLREEISKLYNQINPDHILVAAPEEAILLTIQAILQPEDHVISIFPAYQSLYEIARAKGCEVSYWHVRHSPKGWILDLNELENLYQSNTRLLVVNFPHNPTGFLPSYEDFKAVIEFAQHHNLYLFCDEMYRLLEYSPNQTLSPAADLYPKAISLSGLSKSFALPGLRIGWLATQAVEVLENCAILKDYTTICSSAPSEILAIIALQNRSAILQRNQQIILDNLHIAEHFFDQFFPILEWIPPQAGSVALAYWRGKPNFSAVMERVLDEKGLMILPGSVFDIDDNTFRLGLGRKSFPLALEQLEDWLISQNIS